MRAARSSIFNASGSRGVLIACKWPKNGGGTCTYMAAQSDVTSHQRTVAFHSDERCRRASNASVKTAAQDMFRGSSASTSTLPGKRPAEQPPPTEELPASQQTSADYTLSVLVQAVTQLSHDQQSLVEGLLQHQKVTSSVSRVPCARKWWRRPSCAASTSVRRSFGQEGAAQREAEAAMSKLERALEKAKSIKECCASLGCFSYSVPEELVFCNICTPFASNPELQRRIPGVQVSFSQLNKKNFGAIDASLGDGSPAQFKKKLAKVKQSLRGHLETQGHFYCVSNKVRRCSLCCTLCQDHIDHSPHRISPCTGSVPEQDQSPHRISPRTGFVPAQDQSAPLRLTDCATSIVLGTARSQEQGAAADRSERGVHCFRVLPGGPLLTGIP